MAQKKTKEKLTDKEIRMKNAYTEAKNKIEETVEAITLVKTREQVKESSTDLIIELIETCEEELQKREERKDPEYVKELTKRGNWDTEKNCYKE